MGDVIAATGSQATAMDRMYRLTRHVYDASRKYYLLGRDDLVEGLDPPRGGTVLDIGCGTARNLVAIGRRHPEARLYGLDISEEMLKTARASVARAGFAGRIALAPGDAADFDPSAAFGVARFDRVVFSYTLSMIPPWQAALAHASGLLAPGGRLHAVDFGDGAGLPGPFVRLLRRWLAAFHVTPRDDLDAVLADLAARRGLSLEVRALRRGYARLAVLADDGGARTSARRPT